MAPTRLRWLWLTRHVQSGSDLLPGLGGERPGSNLCLLGRHGREFNTKTAWPRTVAHGATVVSLEVEVVGTAAASAGLQRASGV